MTGSKKFWEKYRLIILYLTFGVITTVCSLGACYLTLKIGVNFIHDEEGNPTALLDVIGSTVQWVVGVIVSFITNKKWVFKGAETGARASLKQFAVFSGSRVGTYFLEVVSNLIIIFLFDICGYTAFILNIFGMALNFTSRFWSKIISSVIVVITNYYISKLLVFKKKKSDSEVK